MNGIVLVFYYCIGKKTAHSGVVKKSRTEHFCSIRLGTGVFEELPWIGEPTKIPFNSKFKVVALRDSTKVPDVFVKSIEERLSDALVEQGRYTPTEEAFTIEIHLSQFDSSTKGAAVDFMIGTGDQKMKARAIFKDPSGKEICYVDIYTRLFTGGLAFIAKASNKVTLLIKEAVMGHLEKDILE